MKIHIELCTFQSGFSIYQWLGEEEERYFAGFAEDMNGAIVLIAELLHMQASDIDEIRDRFNARLRERGMLASKLLTDWGWWREDAGRGEWYKRHMTTDAIVREVDILACKNEVELGKLLYEATQC